MRSYGRTKRMPPGLKPVDWAHSSTPQSSGGFSVLFWGCFSKMGLGLLVLVGGTMNSQKNIKILQEHLLPELEAANNEQDII